MGIAHLLTMAMAKEGVSHAEAVKKIWMVDSKGLIVKVTLILAPTPCPEMDRYGDLNKRHKFNYMLLIICNCISTEKSQVCTVCTEYHVKHFFMTSFQGRSHLNHEKEEFAHEHPHIKTLEEVVKVIKPTALIGNYVLCGTVQPSGN